MLRDFSKEEFDLIVQAGQSNCEGYGIGEVPVPYAAEPSILYMLPDMTITVAREYAAVTGNHVAGNLGLSFARKYAEEGCLEPGRKLLILRAAVGGTGFVDGRWDMQGDLYRHMLDMMDTALSLCPGNRLKALLWHQGETDALGGADRETHRRRLKALVDGVRNRFACPELPFIAGDFVPLWKEHNKEKSAPVSAAMREVCAGARCAFVESDGLLSNEEAVHDGDEIHFSRRALYALGERYYAAYADMVREDCTA